MSRSLLPPATIGIIGGGQLGMMLVREAHRMGYRTVVWDPDPECPASRLADQVIAGAFDDEKAATSIERESDVITYEFENVSPEMVERLERAKPLYPGAAILRIAANRRVEKQGLARHGFPVVPHKIARTREELRTAIAEVSLPVVLKTTTSGYDGKGQAVLAAEPDVARFLESAGENEFVIEKFVELDREISVLVVRTQEGDVVTFPVAENIHRDNILHTTFVPARVESHLEKEAIDLSMELVKKFDVVGLLCIEMFITADGRLLVNELAPRPHNSGHYSLDACSISQFEALLRVLCNLDIPQPRLLTPCAMINILGRHIRHLDASRLASVAGTKLHLYGKKRVEPKRKMGHVTVLGKTLNEVELKAATIIELIGDMVPVEVPVLSK